MNELFQISASVILETKNDPEMNLTSVILSYDDYMFPFEKEADIQAFMKWIERNQYILLSFIALYLGVIFGIQKYMKHRRPYDLQSSLVIWNFGLAAFSICGTWRVLIDHLSILHNYGFYTTVCTLIRYPIVDIWAILVFFSKYVELGDTIFIVLRKKSLIFLHWYHHATVIIFAVYSYHENASIGRWFITNNLCVHSIMYTYFGLRALKINVPRIVSKFITICQITQMIFGILVVAYAYRIKMNNHFCATSYMVLNTAVLIYFSYFVLFLKFFYDAYIRKRTKQMLPDKKLK